MLATLEHLSDEDLISKYDLAQRLIEPFQRVMGALEFEHESDPVKRFIHLWVNTFELGKHAAAKCNRRDCIERKECDLKPSVDTAEDVERKKLLGSQERLVLGRLDNTRTVYNATARTASPPEVVVPEAPTIPSSESFPEAPPTHTVTPSHPRRKLSTSQDPPALTTPLTTPCPDNTEHLNSISGVALLLPSKWHEIQSTLQYQAFKLARDDIPTCPGVYVWRHSNAVAYIGVASNLRNRVWGKHMANGLSLSGSSFRRNVCDLILGIPPTVTGRPVRRKLEREQADIVRTWILDCTVAWIESDSADAARALESRLLRESLPPLNRRR